MTRSNADLLRPQPSCHASYRGARPRLWPSVLLLVTTLAGAEPIAFEWFEYTGRDEVFAQSLPAGRYRNPILAGFYPDPSVTRVGEKFYLVNSTFAYFPGIPVFESEDLVHWKQVGHVIDRPTQLDYSGIEVSQGVFAPTIEHHDGLFYVLNTHVGNGGNYVVTAKSAAGPWSDPVWLPQLVHGIDPSMFVDADGKAYVLNNDLPEGKPLYEGHRAIWIQEFDPKALKLFGPRKLLVNGGVDLSKNPVWVEGPHLYRKDGWYYLSCAEGGTGLQHSQVVFRARSPWGPFSPYERNPILTQRDLPQDRPNPVINAGHADLIEAPDGSWWATFLASRAYDRVHFNTGRETFLLPVEWRDGWPVILDAGRTIPYVVNGPAFMHAGAQAPLGGNYSQRDEFDSGLDLSWVQLRAPERPWFSVGRGALIIEPQSASLGGDRNPSFLARRQQHLAFDASAALAPPRGPGVAAGLAAFQNETHWYFLGVERVRDDARIFIEKANGGAAAVIASAMIEPSAQLRLRISGDGRAYSFFYTAGDGAWRPLKERESGSTLSTHIAEGFVGVVIGPYARLQQSNERHTHAPQ
jgi:xylan 1,4-beta-xylosidase